MHKRIKILITILLCSIRVAIAQLASQPINIWDGTDCKANVKLTLILQKAVTILLALSVPVEAIFGWIRKLKESELQSGFKQMEYRLLYWSIVSVVLPDS